MVMSYITCSKKREGGGGIKSADVWSVHLGILCRGSICITAN